jgi:hypothetical protein
MTSRRSPAAVLEAAELFRRVPGSWGHCCPSAVAAKQHDLAAWPSGRRCWGVGRRCPCDAYACNLREADANAGADATQHPFIKVLTGTSFTQCSPRQLMTTAAFHPQHKVCQPACAASPHQSSTAAGHRQCMQVAAAVAVAVAEACGSQSALPGSNGRISLEGGQSTYWVGGCWWSLLEAAACERARSSWA